MFWFKVVSVSFGKFVWHSGSGCGTQNPCSTPAGSKISTCHFKFFILHIKSSVPVVTFHVSDILSSFNSPIKTNYGTLLLCRLYIYTSLTLHNWQKLVSQFLETFTYIMTRNVWIATETQEPTDVQGILDRAECLILLCCLVFLSIFILSFNDYVWIEHY